MNSTGSVSLKVPKKIGLILVYYSQVSWFSTFSTFFRPGVIPKVLILGQSHTSVMFSIRTSVN